jgi:hypothetical protein
MRLAALLHDLGKALTLFGEEDSNVDCMNRCVQPLPEAGGLDALEIPWNHDDFGYQKLKPYVPQRIADVMRVHSLRELPYGVYTDGTVYNLDSLPDHHPTGPDADPMAFTITKGEARAFQQWLNRSRTDVSRAGFVAHFQWFDAKSKEVTALIPHVDLREAEALIRAYFPGGMVEW